MLDRYTNYVKQNNFPPPKKKTTEDALTCLEVEVYPVDVPLEGVVLPLPPHPRHPLPLLLLHRRLGVRCQVTFVSFVLTGIRCEVPSCTSV